MKYSTLITLITFFGKSVCAQITETGLKESGLKGKVKQITEYLYHGDVPLDTLRKFDKIVINFNESGNYFDDIVQVKGMPVQKEIFSYEGRRKIAKKYYDDKLYCTLIHTYDDKGHEIELDNNLNMGRDSDSKFVKSKYKTTYKYDDKGNRIEENTDGRLANSPNKTVIKFNNKNKKIESERYFPDGKLSDKTFYQYDDLGNEIKCETYNVDGKLTLVHTTSYNNFDEYGNWLLEINISKGHKPVEGDYVYELIIKREILYDK